MTVPPTARWLSLYNTSAFLSFDNMRAESFYWQQ